MSNDQRDNRNGQKPAKQDRQWLLGQVGSHRGMILGVSVLGLAAVAVKLASSVASKYLIDALLARELRPLFAAAVFAAAMMLAGTVLQSLSSHLGARLRIRVHDRLQGQLFGKLLAASWQSLNGYPGGDLLNRLNADVGAVSGGIINLLPGLLLSGARLLAALGILLYFDPVSAWIALVGTPVTLLASRLLMKKMRSHDMTIKELGSGVMSFQEDAIQGLTEIKALNACDPYRRRLEGLQREYAREYLRYNGFRIGMGACLSLLNLTVTAACLCWSLYRLWAGELSYGSMVLLLQMVSMLRGCVSSMTAQFQQMVTVLTSVSRVRSLLELPEEDRRVPEGFDPDGDWGISLNRVCCRYGTGGAVLEDFEFAAEPGEMIGVTGLSGAGKTTLLRLLLGLLEPCAGEARLTGTDGAWYPITAGTRGAFAYVPQGNSIFAGTVAENLRIAAKDATEEELREALETACALEFVEALPEGLHQKLSSGGKSLSEGQCQRLAIARAILRAAPVLLLDEATSGLDEETERKLLENLRRSRRVRTCILVTHRQSVAEGCDRTYVIGPDSERRR